MKKNNIFKKLWHTIKQFLSWRILVCYLPFWFIATGWAYILLAIGNSWCKGIAGTWLGIMWLPFCPEKLITIPLAIWLHKKLFPKHSTTNLEDILKKEKEKNERHNKKK